MNLPAPRTFGSAALNGIGSISPMVKAVKKEQAKRDRTPARERYAVLNEWLKFARGEPCALPNVPLRFTSVTMANDAPTPASGISPTVRQWAADYLRNVAKATAEGLSGTEMPTIE